MFFFFHPRKVTSDRAVAVQMVQNKDVRQPISLVAPVLVVDPQPKNIDFDKEGRPLLR